jgi:GNAT superfamily N-acetyltransferase
MYENIIQQAMAEMVPDYEKIIEKYLEGKDFAVLNTEMKEQSALLGINIIKRLIEDINRMLRESRERHEKGWYVVKDDARSLLTSLGNVRFERTLFINHRTGERAYLTDRMLCLTPGERMTEDAVAQMLEEAAETSYRKGGEACSILGSVSKETVKEKIHGLVFPKEKDLPVEEKKKECSYLYIEADEDHVSLQFHEKRGDLKTNENGYKDNTVLEKLVYVHEGVEKENPKGVRNRLTNAHYFAGGYPGEENKELAVQTVETGFLDFLKNEFFSQNEAAYWIFEENGVWHSALRTCKVLNGPYYLEALETRPDSRKKGYASLLLLSVLDVLKKDGPFQICDCVSKKNPASLKVHEKCGFQIVSEKGYDYLQNEEDDHDFGLEYRYPAE